MPPKKRLFIVSSLTRFPSSQRLKSLFCQIFVHTGWWTYSLNVSNFPSNPLLLLSKHPYQFFLFITWWLGFWRRRNIQRTQFISFGWTIFFFSPKEPTTMTLLLASKICYWSSKELAMQFSIGLSDLSTKSTMPSLIKIFHCH